MYTFTSTVHAAMFISNFGRVHLSLDNKRLLWLTYLIIASRYIISFCRVHGCIQIFFWIPYWPQMLINILWHPLEANQYGGRIWRTGSIFSCTKALWDCLPSEPITTTHQSVFWLVSQSRCMSAICIGICRWISLAVASAAAVVELVFPAMRYVFLCVCSRLCCHLVNYRWSIRYCWTKDSHSSTLCFGSVQ